jgi:hypothetical protein
MRTVTTGGALLALVLLAGGLVGADPLRSGPPAGDTVSPFEPYNVTGDYAGQNYCLVCESGLRPVALVFAREVNGPVTSLLKKLDEATLQNRKAKMFSFLVALNDDTPGTARQLKALAEKEKIQQTVLAVFDSSGPPEYKLAKEAEVVVVLYDDATVRSTLAYRKGELNDKEIAHILDELPRILPKK